MKAIVVTFFRELFHKLAREEVEAGLSDSDEEIPSFGDSLSGYEDVSYNCFVLFVAVETLLNFLNFFRL